MIELLLTGDFITLRFKLAIIAIMWLLVAIAITLDLISGWRKAKERKEARTSYGLRRTVTKAVLYYALMLFAFMFDCILYRDKLVRDSIYLNDTIRVPYPVEVLTEVNRLSPFQWFQVWCGRVLLLLIIGWVGVRWWKKHI